jgi:hypothetical protein
MPDGRNALAYAAIASAQGTVVFDNQATGVKALVYRIDPANPTYFRGVRPPVVPRQALWSTAGIAYRN